jgi:F-type H+-transporting ATPase subunit delta
MKTSRRTRQQAAQLFRLCRKDGLLDERLAQRLLERVLEAQPRGCLALLEAFEQLVTLDAAQRAARVESATPLSAEASSQVRSRLEQAYGTALNLSFAENPALIGGIRITVGSDVYDGSVQRRLARLEERFS